MNRIEVREFVNFESSLDRPYLDRMVAPLVTALSVVKFVGSDMSIYVSISAHVNLIDDYLSWKQLSAIMLRLAMKAC
jgi:hypothetical protein